MLYSIEEEKQGLESSQKMAKSLSMMAKRPGTPDFIDGFEEDQNESETSDNDQEQSQIRARMEAQI